MATERTKRERIWRACQIQRQWRIMDMVAALGIPASTTHGILQELVASGAVVVLPAIRLEMVLSPMLPR